MGTRNKRRKEVIEFIKRGSEREKEKNMLERRRVTRKKDVNDVIYIERRNKRN